MYLYDNNSMDIYYEIEDNFEDLLFIRVNDHFAGYKTNFFNFEDSRASLSVLFTCYICSGVFNKPRQIDDCGHIFCQTCLENLEECPLDNTPLTEDIIFRDKFIEAKIREMDIKCPLYSRGCPWVGELDKGREHLEVCMYVNVKCHLGCEKIMIRKELEVHEETECGFFMTTCEYCDEEVKRVHREEHRTLQCLYYPIKCPNACNIDAMPRCEIPKHLEEECPLGLVKCSYESMGCQALVERQNVRDHMQADQLTHLQLVTEKVKRMSEVMEHLKTENSTLIGTVNNLDANLEEASSLMNSQKLNLENRYILIVI